MRVLLDRAALLTLRSALLNALGIVEDALGLPRSVPPRGERKRDAREAA